MPHPFSCDSTSMKILKLLYRGTYNRNEIANMLNTEPDKVSKLLYKLHNKRLVEYDHVLGIWKITEDGARRVEECIERERTQQRLKEYIEAWLKNGFRAQTPLLTLSYVCLLFIAGVKPQKDVSIRVSYNRDTNEYIVAINGKEYRIDPNTYLDCMCEARAVVSLERLNSQQETQ